jgi:hypothetical protein
LDLSRGEYSSHIAADKTALSGFFLSSSTSTDAPPVCDVLMVYGHVESGGNIRNSRLGLGEIVRDSTAAIVVFATDNPGDNYLQLAKQRNIRANVVMTLDRGGDRFAQFFQKCFTAMKQGDSLLQVWVRLAPQGGSPTWRKDGPEAICVTGGAGHISFA